MNKLADADARRLIEERLDLNVLVEAGAGSGKTYSLAHRVAAGIVRGKYNVDEMVAVTFTRKAAAELRGRFQLALEEKLASAAGDERSRIERALANLEHLFAGTIHAFCAHLLRERPVEANIAPGFTELEELENAEFRQRSWRDYLSRLRGERSPLLDELQQARVSAKDLDGAFAIVCTFDEVEFPPGDAKQPDIKAARKATDAFWRGLQALMPDPVPPDAKCLTLERARKFRRLLRAAGGGRPADLVEALRCWETPPKVTMCWWTDGSQAEQRVVRTKVETLIADFQGATVLPFLAAWRQYLYRLVMELLAGARESARDERRRALALNYGDLLTGAAALLRDNAAVRAALQRKYRWLFVDEFQDTDPIQAEVMLLLAADEGTGDGKTAAVKPEAAMSDAGKPGASFDAYTVPLRPGALFVVGDPKQSIFRFRRADIDVYNRVRETIRGSGGEVVSLTTSFRARPSLCEWTNEVFSKVLPPAATVHQAAFSPLDPDPEWKPRSFDRLRTGAVTDEPGLRILTIPAHVPKGDVVAWDAEATARYIETEVVAGRATFADFLVLTRKKKHLADYAAALQARQIAVEVSGAGAFGGSPVVRALIDLLHVLGDPADGLGIVGVLRGPLFGVSDRQLFAHRQAGGYFGFSAAPAGASSGPGGRVFRPGEGAVADALDRLGGFLRLTRKLRLAAAVERILEESGFLALAAVAAEGAAPAGDVLHAVDLVRAVADEGGSLADAATALEEAADSSEIESVPLEPGRRDVVRVMNLHKAKGLEAAVVFLVDPLGAAKRAADVRIIREGHSARGYLAVSRDVGEHGTELVAHPAGWDQHEAAELDYVDAEESRLLYVAATRARELLVVSRWDKDSKGQRPWSALDAYLAGVPELAVPAAGPATKKTTGKVTAKARAKAATARALREEFAARPSWDATSVTALVAADREGESEGTEPKSARHAEGREGGGGGRESEIAHPPGAHGEQGGGGVEMTDVSEAAASRLDAGVEWGSLVHGLLEHAMRRPGATRADLERLARWLTVETPELRPVIPDALDLVEKIVDAPFWQDARGGSDRDVEVPFAVRIPAGESLGSLGPVRRPTVLHGAIDLVYRTADGWRILDYKTDLAAAAGATLLDRHAPQLAHYRAAWERVTGEKVGRQGIVALRTGTVEWA
jgi:ATP-dependent helicase/nuclease subunit A